MRILFVNTSAPVVPLWEDSFPCLEALGLAPFALVSGGDYRSESEPGISDSRVVRLPCPGYAKRRKVLRHLCFALLAPWGILRRKPEGVVFLTQPPLFHLFASVLCRCFRVPYAVHVMDQYPEVLEASGKLARDGATARFLRSLVKRSYLHARGVVSLGPCATAMLRDRYGVAGERIREIPNWPFRGIEPVPREENRFLREQGWAGDFVVLYSGNLGLGHEADTVAAAVERLRDREGIRFVFVGGGRGFERLREQCGKLPRVSFLPFQPRERLSQSLSAASIHLITLRDEFCGLMVPSKLYGCLASGRPVLFEGPAESTVARTIGATGCGTRIANGDVDGLVAAVERYAGDSELAKREGEAARRTYERAHAPDLSALRYAEGIASLFSNPPAGGVPVPSQS